MRRTSAVMLALAAALARPVAAAPEEPAVVAGLVRNALVLAGAGARGQVRGGVAARARGGARSPGGARRAGRVPRPRRARAAGARSARQTGEGDPGPSRRAGAAAADPARHQGRAAARQGAPARARGPSGGRGGAVPRAVRRVGAARRPRARVLPDRGRDPGGWEQARDGLRRLTWRAPAEARYRLELGKLLSTAARRGARASRSSPRWRAIERWERRPPPPGGRRCYGSNPGHRHAAPARVRQRAPRGRGDRPAHPARPDHQQHRRRLRG